MRGNSYKHGESKSRLYSIWSTMKSRCYNKNNHKYHAYGGRGINICEEWCSDFGKFKKWALSSGYSDNLTIDRIDVNGNYNPLNCRWADNITQNNNRTNNVYLELNGDRKTISEWSRSMNTCTGTIWSRLNRGWSIEKTLTTPIRIRNKRGLEIDLSLCPF